MTAYPDAVRSVESLPCRTSLTSSTYSLLFSYAVTGRTAGEQVRLPLCVLDPQLNLSLADWEKAKAQAECLDYLLEVAVKMRLAGLETEGL